jgi:hypothetical protein
MSDLRVILFPVSLGRQAAAQPDGMAETSPTMAGTITDNRAAGGGGTASEEGILGLNVTRVGVYL